jgi:class 3 adenylate cyclase
VTLRARYLANMAGVSLLHFFAFLSFMLITGKMDRILVAIPMNLFLLIGLNLIGASFIFSPIQKYLKREIGLEKAVKRIHQLSWMSSAWAGFLVFCLSFTAFFVFNVLCPTCNLSDMAPFYVTMITVFCTFVSIIIFFMVDDFAAVLKAQMFEEFGDLVSPTGAQLRRKFIAAFIAIGVAPGLLIFLEIFAFSDIRKLQGITSEQAFAFDLLLITVIAGAAFYFIQKNLSRPIEALLASMREVGEGNLDTRAVILTDDEIGSLASNFNNMIEQVQDREFIKETFGRYVPESVATAILENKGEFKAQHRLATILYTDIQSFTTICESLSPDGVVGLLNEYFSLLFEVIDKRGGVVNQFQGDAMLVTFNIPVTTEDHAAVAVQTAIEIQQVLTDHIFCHGDKMVTRIGVNTGNVVAGSVGANDRLNYTVHGDAVNVAARLESLNKEFGSLILISEDTKNLAEATLGSSVVYEAKGELPIRGKTEAIKVFEVTGTT